MAGNCFQGATMDGGVGSMSNNNCQASGGAFCHNEGQELGTGEHQEDAVVHV